MGAEPDEHDAATTGTHASRDDGGARPRPLADVRVLAIEQFGAGPYGSMHLVDLGAEVIKIEDPSVEGDVGRYVPPYAEDGDSLFFETFNRGKRSLSLDLRSPEGRRVFEDLVAVSDAVYSNLRGDVPAKMAITYEHLRKHNPAIVCVSLSGFGMTGPRIRQPGCDIVMQALGGWMAVTGEPDGPPTKSGLSLVDYAGGFVAALALLAGLHAARRDGVGMDCDVSLFDTALGMIAYPGTWQLTRGREGERTHHSAHPSLVPFQSFACADGWLVIACPKEKFWRRLTAVIDRADLADDPRFASFAGRREHADEVLAELDRTFARRPVAEWVAALQGAGVPCAPVNSISDALAEEHIAARGSIVETEHPRWGCVFQVASPVRAGVHQPARRRAPRRGEDRDDILTKILGYDHDRADRLAADGAFGALSPGRDGTPLEATHEGPRPR